MRVAFPSEVPLLCIPLVMGNLFPVVLPHVIWWPNSITNVYEGPDVLDSMRDTRRLLANSMVYSKIRIGRTGLRVTNAWCSCVCANETTHFATIKRCRLLVRKFRELQLRLDRGIKMLIRPSVPVQIFNRQEVSLTPSQIYVMGRQLERIVS